MDVENTINVLRVIHDVVEDIGEGLIAASSHAEPLFKPRDITIIDCETNSSIYTNKIIGYHKKGDYLLLDINDNTRRKCDVIHLKSRTMIHNQIYAEYKDYYIKEFRVISNVAYALLYSTSPYYIPKTVFIGKISDKLLNGQLKNDIKLLEFEHNYIQIIKTDKKYIYFETAMSAPGLCGLLITMDLDTAEVVRRKKINRIAIMKFHIKRMIILRLERWK